MAWSGPFREEALYVPVLSPTAPPESNRLLAQLPQSVSARILPYLEAVSLEVRQSLVEPDEPLRHVYFLRGAVTSVLVPMEGGGIVEVATIGWEGLVGPPLVPLDGPSPYQVICQIAGEAAQVSAGTFTQLVDELPALRRLLDRHTLTLGQQIARTAACNRLHTVEERLARWLLLSRDRVGSDQFPMTQEFLALMLGVRRPSVTVAAGILQQAGLVRYRYGRISLTDPEGLEAAACEDYRLTQSAYERTPTDLYRPPGTSDSGRGGAIVS